VKRFTRLLYKLDRAGMHAEDALLLIILIGMILLAGTQIFLRNLLDTSLFWGDEMLRLMVLWLAVAGGLAASRLDKHISIAVIDRFLPGKAQLATRVVIDLFTAAICVLFAWHSARFVYSSYEFGDTVMRDVPAWAAQVIMPIGFGLMALRHLILAFTRPFRDTEASNESGGDT
jgi:TRAP-type C4-dicarboxylate transport system permease small subunit